LPSASSTRSFTPQRRDQGLSPGSPHRIELAGSPRDIAWPGVCASCGSLASERVPVTKVFLRYFGRRTRRWDVDDIKPLVTCTIAVPFCAACAARHRQLEHPIGLVRQLTSYVSSVFVIPFAIAAFAAATYFDPTLLGSAAVLVAAPATGARAAVFALAAALFAVLVWHQTRHKRVPRQTEVTASFDFSDNMGNIVGGQRRIYAMSNAAFAEAFATANAGRLWTPERKAAARRRENVAAAAVAAIVLAAAAYAIMT
jgi:hypothetical protein